MGRGVTDMTKYWGIPLLISLCQSHYKQIQEQAILALGNIAGYSESVCLLMYHSDLPKVLHSLIIQHISKNSSAHSSCVSLRDDTYYASLSPANSSLSTASPSSLLPSLSIQSSSNGSAICFDTMIDNILFFLSRYFRFIRNRDEIELFLPLITTSLAVSDPLVLSDSLTALMYICEGGTFLDLINGEEIIPLLLGFLKQSQYYVIQPAVRALSYMASYSAKFSQIMVSKGAIQLLTKIIAPSMLISTTSKHFDRSSNSSSSQSVFSSSSTSTQMPSTSSPSSSSPSQFLSMSSSPCYDSITPPLSPLISSTYFQPSGTSASSHSTSTCNITSSNPSSQSDCLSTSSSTTSSSNPSSQQRQVGYCQPLYSHDAEIRLDASTILSNIASDGTTINSVVSTMLRCGAIDAALAVISDSSQPLRVRRESLFILSNASLAQVSHVKAITQKGTMRIVLELIEEMTSSHLCEIEEWSKLTEKEQRRCTCVMNKSISSQTPIQMAGIVMSILDSALHIIYFHLLAGASVDINGDADSHSLTVQTTAPSNSSMSPSPHLQSSYFRNHASDDFVRAQGIRTLCDLYQVCDSTRQKKVKRVFTKYFSEYVKLLDNADSASSYLCSLEKEMDTQSCSSAALPGISNASKQNVTRRTLILPFFSTPITIMSNENASTPSNSLSKELEESNFEPLEENDIVDETADDISDIEMQEIDSVQKMTEPKPYVLPSSMLIPVPDVVEIKTTS
ncbi:uncharacterized protein MONOS_1314 [Monocercomonoides exilis]|uniref:uncharacterized protein n=1 Tax=Monocercomonoides exilis TaxID=2049356 RepID=UPI00355946D8|nr:hypothetical protein MONOS_1314 [Monocercomonoides exilis]|eukprot:MONOS_1314.1-p1 / transcript=MONOS_1314.1 / gene=MONOS_1314 / organism=Monocercomonoides_exilis_PA203 / gene_product=unspecified product / transcript_product=unspecified product / location=Mono_scaffold00022:170289-172585(+) / protein_length=736 / sequence_SO=supercontig / SO=protein_coding / is_pseudo=false